MKFRYAVKAAETVLVKLKLPLEKYAKLNLRQNQQSEKTLEIIKILLFFILSFSKISKIVKFTCLNLTKYLHKTFHSIRKPESATSQ